MSSRWSESGVDWSNIYNNRLESVVREFYQAVNEREYWMNQVMNNRRELLLSGYPAPTLDIQGNRRTSYEYNYICTILKKWFQIEPANNPEIESNNRFFYWFSTSCFVIEGDYSSFDLSKYGNGLKYYDYGEGGELEDLVGDLGFLRDFGDGQFRGIDGRSLETIYKILNSGLKFRTRNIQEIRSVISGSVYTQDSWGDDYSLSTSSSRFDGDSKSESYTKYTSNPPVNEILNNRDFSQYDSRGVDGQDNWSFSHINSFLRIPSNYTNNGITLNNWADLNFFYKNYTDDPVEAGLPDPSWESDSVVIENEGLSVSVSYPQPFSKFTEDYTIKKENVSFIDLSSMVGFLNYYTEPDD